MNLRNKWTMGLLSLAAVATIGVSATTLYSPVYSTVYAQSDNTEQTPVPEAQRPSRTLASKEEQRAILAEVLGISDEELQTAMTTARNAAIDQAVADGELTQEQADAMKAKEGGRGRGWGLLGRGADHDEELAAALGITLEELQAAKEEVQERVLAEAVAAGEITQEEADLIAARHALHEYLRDRMQTAYEEAVAQAVADGVITQAQADQILSEQGPGFFGPRMGGPRGGHHGKLDGGPAGRPEGGRGRGPGLDPNQTPLTPESETPESSNTSASPANSFNL